MSDEVLTQDLVSTESYSVWISQEPDGETIYHVDLGMVSLNFFREEWEEMIELIRQAAEADRRRK